MDYASIGISEEKIPVGDNCLYLLEKELPAALITTATLFSFTLLPASGPDKPEIPDSAISCAASHRNKSRHERLIYTSNGIFVPRYILIDRKPRTIPRKYPGGKTFRLSEQRVRDISPRSGDISAPY